MSDISIMSRLTSRMRYLRTSSILLAATIALGAFAIACSSAPAATQPTAQPPAVPQAPAVQPTIPPPPAPSAPAPTTVPPTAVAPAPTAEPQPTSAPAPTAEPAFAPVTIENCGTSTTYDSIPEKAVALNQHATEIMLALGLEDHLVGTAYIDDEILPEFQDAYNEIEVLSAQYPSKEVFLNTEATFAYGGFRSAFSEDGVGLREDLSSLGIDTYLTSIFCIQDRVEAPSIDEVYDDILNIGSIFGVEDRAEDLVHDMEHDLEEVSEALEGVDDALRVFVYDSGDEAPFTASCCGTAQLVVELSGGENIFEDVPGGWATVSWEEIIDRDPEVILLIDSDWSTADEKAEFMIDNPALSDITAVKDRAFIVIPFSFTVPGVRNSMAIEEVSHELYPDHVGHH